MKISTILDHIDSRHMALPEFQRGFVWNRDQVRGLFDSLYKRHPIGGLLVWATQSTRPNGQSVANRGNGPVAAGVVKLLLDGQQRMTSLYGVARGKPPEFFDGNPSAFWNLRFHLDREEFAFYSPVFMRDDPLWIDVSELLKEGYKGHEKLIQQLSEGPKVGMKAVKYSSRVSRLLGILDVDLHIEEVTGEDKSLDVVVDIFNRVNSGGTKLSKGDLALAKICSDWPQARDRMKTALKGWEENGYYFNLDWLLRSVNTVLTGEAKFMHLHEKSAEDIQVGLERALKWIDKSLNIIGGRLGLDYDRVLFARFAIPVMVHYLDRCGGVMDSKEQDKLLFWFVQAGMWGRFSGSTESKIDQDLAAMETPDRNLDPLLEQMRLWHGTLRVEPGHFTGWSLGARFYPVLYMLTRVSEARDWGTGMPLKSGMLGKMSQLEVHHIFPKSQLYEAGYKRPEVNAVANFCFLTKETNIRISDRLPEEYFPEVEAKHPGALASQWIPGDKELWKLENYRDFLEARKEWLAEATNEFLKQLLHDDTRWLEGPSAPIVEEVQVNELGGIESEEDDQKLEALNNWVAEHGLPRGNRDYEIAHPETGAPEVRLDLAWPSGLQEGLSEPVAVLLNEERQVLAQASERGYRCFTDIEPFKQYVRSNVLSEEYVA